jgi:hypothetical protein
MWGELLIPAEGTVRTYVNRKFHSAFRKLREESQGILVSEFGNIFL